MSEAMSNTARTRLIIKHALVAGMRVTIPEIQRRLKLHGIHAMETTISARIRDLRKEKYGGYSIGHRLRHGTHLHEYFIEHDQQGVAA